jgi:hypothetical protein
MAARTPITVAHGGGVKLEMTANRGVKVWPEGSPQTLRMENFRFRFFGTTPGQQPAQQQILDLLDRGQ